MQEQGEEPSRFVQPTPQTSLQANPIYDWHNAYDETKEASLNITTSSISPIFGQSGSIERLRDEHEPWHYVASRRRLRGHEETGVVQTAHRGPRGGLAKATNIRDPLILLLTVRPETNSLSSIYFLQNCRLSDQPRASSRSLRFT